MAKDRPDSINKGPKDEQFNKGQSRHGKVSKKNNQGSGMKDQQFNKNVSRGGEIGEEDSGPSGMQDEQMDQGRARPAAKFGKKSKGGSDMEDQQFSDGESYNDVNDDGDASAGKKTKGGMKLEAGKLSAAHKIMQAVAIHAQKDSSSISKRKSSSGGDSEPGSANQSKFHNASNKRPSPNGSTDVKKDKK